MLTATNIYVQRLSSSLSLSRYLSLAFFYVSSSVHSSPSSNFNFTIYDCKLITESKQRKHLNMKDFERFVCTIFFFFFALCHLAVLYFTGILISFSCSFVQTLKKHSATLKKLNKGWILLNFQKAQMCALTFWQMQCLQYLNRFYIKHLMYVC